MTARTADLLNVFERKMLRRYMDRCVRQDSGISVLSRVSNTLQRTPTIGPHKIDAAPMGRTFATDARYTCAKEGKSKDVYRWWIYYFNRNNSLKLELEACYQKVAKSQKLEQEVGKVTRAHEELVASCERRERLERAARARLQGELMRLQELNQNLLEQTQLMSRAPSRAPSPDHSRNEITKREALIAQLVTQNKELMAAKERQEIELAAQRPRCRSRERTSTSSTRHSPTHRATSSGSKKSAARSRSTWSEWRSCSVRCPLCSWPATDASRPSASCGCSSSANCAANAPETTLTQTTPPPAKVASRVKAFPS
ncbi:serine/arginine repetitive matrix protein 1-like [Nilaparvata lugens]|uniref:serine/arginine repetitive matrix protein 1-like n=1 Tax=Nilaparvata lugens TaxID=108931 RepID=UPI00193D1ABE|nr:serine/arginine repetitive matrix protein 1-like [Nilaparvata lugens]